MTLPDEALQEQAFELLDDLQHHQLLNAGAEVAAAFAHALGTPLNVISGRAELIRQNPATAMAQVARIEEQVQKLASGIRHLVDFLAVPEPSDEAVPVSAEPAVVPAATVLQQALALAMPIADARGVELVGDPGGLGDASVDRWHALGTLNMLLSMAIRWASKQTPNGGTRPKLRLEASAPEGWVVFELSVPGLDVLSGWQLEHFQARPSATRTSAPYRALAICGAAVRGRGGKLQVEAAPDGASALIRFSCRPGSGAS
jgi:light-regulated signal transduction histidine kinase (bacteriophytochrome)